MKSLGVIFCFLVFDFFAFGDGRQIQLPIFMEKTSVEAKAKFNKIINRSDLRPIERRRKIERLINIQSKDVVQAYQQYKTLLQRHQQKFGISLKAELNKVRKELKARG